MCVCLQVFCTDAPDGPYARKSPFLTLSSKTSLQPGLTERAAVRLLRPEAVKEPFSGDAWTALGRPPQLNPLVGAVHLYTDCGPAAAAAATSFEGVAVRFKTRLTNTPLFVAYRQLRDVELMGRSRTNGTRQEAPEPPAPQPRA